MQIMVITILLLSTLIGHAKRVVMEKATSSSWYWKLDGKGEVILDKNRHLNKMSNEAGTETLYSSSSHGHAGLYIRKEGGHTFITELTESGQNSFEFDSVGLRRVVSCPYSKCRVFSHDICAQVEKAMDNIDQSKLDECKELSMQIEESVREVEADMEENLEFASKEALKASKGSKLKPKKIKLDESAELFTKSRLAGNIFTLGQMHSGCSIYKDFLVKDRPAERTIQRPQTSKE